jgi:hypothetical protein
MYRVVAIVLIAGCSYLQIDRPPRAVRRGDVMPGCTSSKQWPTIDAAIAGLAIVGGIGVLAGVFHPTRDNGDGTMTELTGLQKDFVGVASIGEGALFGLSSLYGFRTVDACVELQQRTLRGTP